VLLRHVCHVRHVSHLWHVWHLYYMPHVPYMPYMPHMPYMPSIDRDRSDDEPLDRECDGRDPQPVCDFCIRSNFFPESEFAFSASRP